jgi:glycosyltransferase involved in cell wall biosynthesis
MQAAAIFVSPARYEPFGLSVLEAAGAGCALVLSDIPTFRELWDGAAIFVSADDAGGLRGALIDLCADSRSRAWLQQAALTRAENYSMQQMTAGYGRLYRRLLSGRSNAGSRLVGACA